MKFTKFKTKDYVLLGIITVIYFVLYMIISVILGMVVPALSYLIAIQIFSLIGGIIIVFLLYKIPKMWVLTILTIIYEVLLILMGMLYLPWLLGTFLGAIIADFIASSATYTSKVKNALAFAVMQIGSILGMLIPIWFFVDYYKKTVETIGNPPEMVGYAIKAFSGWSGIFVIITTFIAAFLGIYLGYAVLSKHFKK